MTQWGLDALFNPSKRHMDEEKARLQSTREEVGDASGGKRIDLDSGRVRIGRPGGEAATGSGDAATVGTESVGTESVGTEAVRTETLDNEGPNGEGPAADGDAD